MPLNELAGIRGIKAVRAIRLAAAYELCQRCRLLLLRRHPWGQTVSLDGTLLKISIAQTKSAGGALDPLVVSGRPSSDYDDRHGPQVTELSLF